MLSEALREHDQVLSLSELFSALAPFRFDPVGVLSREQFVDILTRPRAETSLLLKHHAETRNFLYPVDGPGNYGRSGVPPLAAMPFS
jgi:hypothetical protein